MKLSKQRLAASGVLALALAALGYDRLLSGDPISGPQDAVAAEGEIEAAPAAAAPARSASLRPGQLITVSSRLAQATLLPA
ncbi:MAG: hypothetical protein ACT4PL_11905, partial [Phycisphaerales bacterium]